MKTYKIPVYWQMCGTLYIEANSFSEAIDKAYNESLPDGDYVSGSFEVEEYIEEYEHEEE